MKQDITQKPFPFPCYHTTDETDHDEQRGPVSAIMPRARRVPSLFANAPRDHFSQEGGVPVAAHAGHQLGLAESEGAVP